MLDTGGVNSWAGCQRRKPKSIPARNFFRYNVPMSNTADQFLDAVSKQRSREFTISYWPLSPVQTNPYFEAEQALDVYNIIQKLKKTRTDKEIGMLFGWPAVLRNFMLNCGIVGLKTACKVGLSNIFAADRVSYLEHLVAILGTMVNNDPLCLDSMSLILSRKEVGKIVAEEFILVTDKNRKKLVGAYLAFWAWCWAIYYNAFIDLGFEIHGPYELDNSKSLIVRDFHHIKNLPFWPISQNIPFNRVTFYQIYNTQDLHLSFSNILTTPSKAGLGGFLQGVQVVADSHVLTDAEIVKVTKQMFDTVRQQNDFLNTLSSLVQLKKVAEFTSYSLKDLYKAVGQEPKGVEYVEMNLRRFGKRFLEQYHKISHQNEEYIRQIYDPRNNLLAEDIQKLHSGTST